MVRIQFSAVVTLSEDTRVDLYTREEGGRWEWFGYEKEVTGYDDLGCRVYRGLRHVDSGDARYDSSASAILAGVEHYGSLPQGTVTLVIK